MRSYSSPPPYSISPGTILAGVLVLNVVLYYAVYLPRQNLHTHDNDNDNDNEKEISFEEHKVLATENIQRELRRRRTEQEAQTCNEGDQICLCVLVRVGPRHAKNLPALVWGFLAGRFQNFKIILMETEVPSFFPYLLKIRNQTRDNFRVIVSPELPLVNSYGYEQLNNELDRQLQQDGGCTHFLMTSGDYLYTHIFLERVTQHIGQILERYRDSVSSEYVPRSANYRVTKGVPLLGVSIFSRRLLENNAEIRFRGYEKLPSDLRIVNHEIDSPSVGTEPWFGPEWKFLDDMGDRQFIYWFTEVHIYVR